MAESGSRRHRILTVTRACTMLRDPALAREDHGGESGLRELLWTDGRKSKLIDTSAPG